MPASNFTATIAAWSAKTAAQLDDGGRRVVYEILRRVIERSPIGDPEWPEHSGQLKGNWEVSSDAPTYSYDITLLDENGDETLLRGYQVIDAIRFDKNYHIFIANHVPYAVSIEYGSSPGKAPEGMVRVTLAEFAQIVNEVFVLGGGAP